ncbi:MAG: YciI family protein [Acidobacteriaceae bacterium]|nr:YciI family protein [Acidobacteriaceae bacterium]
MYVITLIYRQPLDVVDRFRAEHHQFLDALYSDGTLLASGPQVPRTGGVLIANGSIDRDVLMKTLERDPFWREQLAEYSVVSFQATKKCKQLEGFE